jgi:hypothetical protein
MDNVWKELPCCFISKKSFEYVMAMWAGQVILCCTPPVLTRDRADRLSDIQKSAKRLEEHLSNLPNDAETDLYLADIAVNRSDPVAFINWVASTKRDVALLGALAQKARSNLRGKMGRPTQEQKRDALRELFAIWHKATGQEPTGKRFVDFANLALSAALPKAAIDGEVRNFKEDFAKIRKEWKQEGNQWQISYWPEK